MGAHFCQFKPGHDGHCGAAAEASGLGRLPRHWMDDETRSGCSSGGCLRADPALTRNGHDLGENKKAGGWDSCGRVTPSCSILGVDYDILRRIFFREFWAFFGSAAWLHANPSGFLIEHRLASEGDWNVLSFRW